MRSYWNNSNQAVTYKVWTLSNYSVTNNNLQFITSNGITARIVQDDPQVINHNGHQYFYKGHQHRVEFETTCEKQEGVLQLIYGKDLLLLTVNVVAPNSIIHSQI